jgi:hypothetical protein
VNNSPDFPFKLLSIPDVAGFAEQIGNKCPDNNQSSHHYDQPANVPWSAIISRCRKMDAGNTHKGWRALIEYLEATTPVMNGINADLA